MNSGTLVASQKVKMLQTPRIQHEPVRSKHARFEFLQAEGDVRAQAARLHRILVKVFAADGILQKGPSI